MTTSATDNASPGYTVLARRYRSRDFDEVIGQEPIARTLENAVKAGRTAHAYLFTGTRGVGKTSMARILAKALNATDDLAQKGEIADAILRGDDLDVIEIDGASNRGIADAKELIAGAGLSPARCPYKIYIIDEVHMLTREAFNALLKTMEEPPSHVKFILCTTETHKVPQTIQSRCQRFDFRPIPTVKIAQQLRMILEKEGLNADDEVVMQVAQLGNGSMRDALSLLDRLLAAGEKQLTTDLVEQMLGLPEQSLVIGLVDAIVAGDAKRALSTSDELLRQGATIEQILDLLAEHFRTLMILVSCGKDSELLELSPEQRKTANEQAEHFDAAGLVHLIAMCDAVSRNARASAAERALFDAAIVRMCLSEHFTDLTAAIRGTGSDSQQSKKTASSPSGGSKKKDVVPEQALNQRAIDARNAAAHAPAQHTAPSVTELKPASESASRGAAGTSDPEPPGDGAALWEKVKAQVSGSRIGQTMIESLEYEAFDGRTLTLSFNEHGAAMARYLQSELERITTLVRNVGGRSIHVVLQNDQQTTQEVTSQHTAHQEVRDLPLVKQAMDIFDASVVDVQDAPPPRDAANEGDDVNTINEQSSDAAPPAAGER